MKGGLGAMSRATRPGLRTDLERAKTHDSAPRSFYGGSKQEIMKYRVTIAALMLGMAAAATARADVRLAFVDIQRALNECRAGKAAKTQFRGRIEHLQSQLEGEQS